MEVTLGGVVCCAAEASKDPDAGEGPMADKAPGPAFECLGRG